MTAEGTPGWLARLALWLPPVGWVVALVVGVGARPVFDWTLREDHPVEWGQFALVLLSCVLAAAAAGQLFKTAGHRLAVAVLSVYAGGAFVLSGEEISWGQRVLNVGTPDDLTKINHQGELNLHNINAGGIPVERLLDLVLVAIAIVGAGLPLVVWLSRRPLPAVLRTLCPPLVVAPLFAQMLVYQALSSALTVVRGREYDLVVRFQELPEFFMHLGMALSMAFIYTRSRSVAAGGSVDRPSGPWLTRTHMGVVWPATAVVVALTVVLAVVTVASGGMPGNAGEVTGGSVVQGGPAH